MKKVSRELRVSDGVAADRARAGSMAMVKAGGMTALVMVRAGGMDWTGDGEGRRNGCADDGGAGKTRKDSDNKGGKNG